MEKRGPRQHSTDHLMMNRKEVIAVRGNGHMHPRGMTTLRVQGRPREGYAAYTLTVPATICRLLPAALAGALFTCELTDDGILFRPLSAPNNSSAEPEWVKAMKDG